MTSRGNQEDDFRDFDFDVDEDGGGQEISFDDFADDANIDDDLFADEDGDDDGGDYGDGDGGDTGGTNGGGPSRTFVIIAGVMVVILLLVGGLLVALATGIIVGPPSEFDILSTQIAATNAAVAIQIEQTNAQGTAIFFQTQTAEAFTDTPTPTATETPTETPDVGATQTILAQSANETSTIVAQTAQATQLTLVGQVPTTVVPGTGSGTPGVSLNNVLGTATALAATLQAQRTGIPTVGSGGGLTPVVNPTLGAGGGGLPDTGLFDDLGAGGPGMMLLLGLGLVGIIAVSRGARAANKNTK